MQKNDLLSQLRVGNAFAWKRVISTTSRRATKLSRCPADADEICSMALFRIYQRIWSMKDGVHLARYAAVVVRNESRRFYAARNFVSLDSLTDRSSFAAGFCARDNLQDVVEGLGELDWKILKALYLYGDTVAQAAERLSLSRAALLKRLSRLRKSLQASSGGGGGSSDGLDSS